MRTPHILVLDNSPRRLGTAWFRKWFRQLDCRVSAYYYRRKPQGISLDRFDAVVVGGSPASATEDEPWIWQQLELIEQADRLGQPVLGVCFGAQLLARAYYGRATIRSAAQLEIGWHCVRQSGPGDLLFTDIPTQFTSFQFHTEEVIPQAGMHVLASSAVSEVQAFRVPGKPVWGIQFHLEVTPRAGRDLLRKTQKVYQAYGLNYDELVAAARPSEAAPQLFSNFLGVLKRRSQ